ncbi:sulfurtransferase TusA family protein [Acidianus sp. HS-5]|uniref:sulfurtransferase TusA family protein n=1 Tax=Acidianus sp. HS-5 TaxID=2886040 RepID=UPI001F490017|nr:sulfurtransferase TusA family protein [Acidianus sp. HS-5]BDC17236.1 oxidoreductase [Acidianus sp. HS-5]
MEELNLVNLECPEPFLKVSAKIMEMKNGEQLKVFYKDPKCDEMLMQLTTLANCQVLQHEEKEGVFTLVLEKKKEEKKRVDLSDFTGC